MHHEELFLEIFADAIPFRFFFLAIIEKDQIIDSPVVFVFDSIVDPANMLFSHIIWNKHIFKFLRNTRPQLTNKMGFLKMPLNLAVVPVVNVFELFKVAVTQITY